MSREEDSMNHKTEQHLHSISSSIAQKIGKSLACRSLSDRDDYIKFRYINRSYHIFKQIISKKMLLARSTQLFPMNVKENIKTCQHATNHE